MRFLDIAVASGYAAICLTLIVVISPVAPREAAVQAAAHMRLDSAISAYVARAGLPFFASSSHEAICGTALEASNATLVFDVLVQGVGCGVAHRPVAPLASSSLTLSLPGREVVIEAWLARR